MNLSVNNLTVVISTIVMTNALSGNVSAASGQRLEEVVVTAQKRSESIQDVPISMQAMSGDDIQQMGITRSDEVLKLYPNLNISKQSENNTNIFIRGVGTSDFHLNNVSAVGVYLDEVSINSPYGTSFSLFDMERAEILRGPQNTLFGRNTTGGAVNFISRKPDPEQEVNGYIMGTVGRDDEFDIEGAVSLPMTDRLAMRISAVTNNRDNIWDNPLTDNEWGEIERHAARLQLHWLPSESLDVLWNLHGGVNRGNGRPFKNFGLQDPNNPSLPCPVASSQLQVDPMPNCAAGDGFVPNPKDWNDVFSAEDTRENIDIWGISLKLSWELEAVTFSSITSYDKTEIARNDDSDGSPGIIFQFYQEGNLDQWSQEFRFASPADNKIRWIAGLYYFLEESDYLSAVRRTPVTTAPSAPGSFTIVPATNVQQDNEVVSIYGQGEYDLSEQLTLTLGLRWSNETKEGVNTTSVGNGLLLPNEDFFVGFGGVAQSIAPWSPLNQPNGGVCPPPKGGLPCVNPKEQLDGDWDEWGGRISLDYRMNDDFLIYGSISRGFKGGGFSVAALSGITGLAAQPVEPEILIAYEIGGKLTLLDNSLRLNGAIFFYDWEDLQSFQVLDGTPQLLNVPEASLSGAELEVQYVPAEGWFIQAGIGYLNGEVEDAGKIATVQEGNDLVQTPELTANLLIRKEFTLEHGLISLQMDFNYRDDVAGDLSNTDFMYVDDHYELNARAAYGFGANEQYRLTLWAKNLTDEEYLYNKIDMRGLSDNVLGVPNDGIVSYGLTFQVNFN